MSGQLIRQSAKTALKACRCEKQVKICRTPQVPRRRTARRVSHLGNWASARKTQEKPAVCLAIYSGELESAAEARYGIVVSKFNSLVTKSLLQGCLEGFAKFNVKEAQIDISWVPGSFELAIVAKSMAKSGNYESIVTLGAVIEGGTSHYDAVVNAATSGILRAGLDTGVPVIFGVLTCDTIEQALDRAGGKMGNKGYDAAMTAIEMSSLLYRLERDENAVLQFD